MIRRRLHRLESDYEKISQVFSTHQSIRLEDHFGDPADRYIFSLQVPGLREEKDSKIRTVDLHKVEVILPIEYPRRAPFCRMLTPVYHPNIDPQRICIGDHWNAGESLHSLIIRIGEMICFQSYNVKSPLNAKAAVWCSENINKLPLSSIDLEQTP